MNAEPTLKVQGAFSRRLVGLPPEPAPNRGRGRPRKHHDNAAKQEAYRRRKQDPERQALVDAIVWKTRIQTGQSIEAIERELRKLSVRKLREKLRAKQKEVSERELYDRKLEGIS